MPTMTLSDPSSFESISSVLGAVVNTSDDEALLSSAQRTLRIEAQAITDLVPRIDARFVRAVRLLLGCQGRVVVSGIGKSGHIGRKIAATLASTGTPALFVHAAEAAHGDLGMITPQDVVVALSHSGETAELLTIAPLLKRLGVRLIVISGNPQGELAQAADVHLDSSVQQEACPLNLAPTASSTAALAIGDALAVACLEARGFGQEDFARSHPGGALGRRLLTQVRDVMRQGPALPCVGSDTPVVEALAEISRQGMGMAVVLDARRQVVGIFTDGDLRRLIARVGDIRQSRVADGMTARPISIAPQRLASEAALLMDEHRKNQLLVIDEGGQLVGALHMHDLLAAKVV